MFLGKGALINFKICPKNLIYNTVYLAKYVILNKPKLNWIE